MAENFISPSRRAIMTVALATPAAAAIGYRMGDTASDTNRIDVMPFIPDPYKDHISRKIRNNDPTDARIVTLSIQRALNRAARENKPLFIPAGLYNICPVGDFAAEAGSCQRCFDMKSGMRIIAEEGATFRIINAVSHDRNVAFMCIFGSNDQVRDIHIENLVLDMNGQNNLISPNRDRGQFSLLNQAHIFVSGANAGKVALASNVTIRKCRFLNTPGVSCIVTGQSNSYSVELGCNWEITDCSFINNGMDTNDHSSIYAWSTDVLCQGCLFFNDHPMGKTGGNVAFEIHGSRQKFINNRIHNYYQAVWVDGNRSEPVSHSIIVSNNTCLINCFGIMFYGDQARNSNVSILDNNIVIDDIPYTGVDMKIAIGCLSNVAQSNISISGNSITSKSKRTASSGVTVQSSPKRGNLHTDITISRNIVIEATFGVQLITNAINDLGAIVVDGNKFRNLSKAGAFSIPQGIGADFQGKSSRIRSLRLTGNVCTDDRRKLAQCAYGIRIQGQIDDLETSRNVASGMTVAAYAEGTLDVARRR